MVTIKNIISCESCGVEVETIRTTTRFCSDRCRLRARKIRDNGRKKCRRCVKPIIGLQNVIFCSDFCRETYKKYKRTFKLRRIKCKHCNRSLLVKHTRKYCSPNCTYLSYYSRNKDRLSAMKRSTKEILNLRCKECGKHFGTTNTRRVFCSVKCGDKFSDRQKEIKRREKIMINGKVDWSISIERLTKRDGRKCYLCNKDMNYMVHTNHNLYPSIEHVHPISKGGTHSWDNVKLAHRICNSLKSDSVKNN